MKCYKPWHVIMTCVLAALPFFTACDKDSPEPDKPGPGQTVTPDPDVPNVPSNGLKSGVYLGIKGFNQQLYSTPIKYLDGTTFTDFNAFIDRLTTANGTILYYSVDQALSTLRSATLPSDLSTVAIVTFTDGLDQGSLAMTDKYDDRLAYLNAVHDRLETEKVAGRSIVAYSIGLRGNDVSDNAMFTDNLKKLAYPSENAKEVTNISQVNAEFEKIAKTLSESNYFQKLTLKCPVVSNGATIRFTLDNVTTPGNVSKSKIYIEGTYNLRDKSLEDIVYHGMECPSGTTVKGVQNGIFVSFTFDNIKTDNNYLIKPENIREWEYVSYNKWQINSEFDTENGAEVKVTRSSAAIMLVLDCSSSLGTQFKTVQTSAKNFINILYKAVSQTDPGNSGTDPNPGTNPETGNMVNGHEYVDLGLPSGLKWATCNVGASSPTETGDYFAWGETSPKDIYTYYNSKTYDKSIGQISGNPEYDAARANWGGTWRMPSSVEMQELVDKCTWKWTSKSGITGQEVTGPNGNSIFLPAAGYFSESSISDIGFNGCYSSSTPGYNKQSLYFLSFINGTYKMNERGSRWCGFSIRAVTN